MAAEIAEMRELAPAESSPSPSPLQDRVSGMMEIEEEMDHLGIADNDRTRQQLANLDTEDGLLYLFNNQWGTEKEDAGSQECEHQHAHMRQNGLAVMTRASLCCKETAEMNLDFGRIIANSSFTNRWAVKGRSSGDVRFVQQAESVSRIAAMISILQGHFGEADQQSVFSAIDGKRVAHMTISDLQREGIKLKAKVGPKWSRADEQAMDGAIDRLRKDPTSSGDTAEK